MSVSYNLLLALLLLAPGFGVYAGLHIGSQSGRIRSPPPAPGSVTTLAIVTIGAAGAHLAAVIALLGEPGLCDATQACFHTSWEPNPYKTLLIVSRGGGARSPEQIASVLMMLAILTGLAMLVAGLAANAVTRFKPIHGLLFGWLADVAAADDDEVIVAYVLSDVEADGTVVGYAGAVDNLAINSDKEVTYILLSDCELFYLRVDARGVRQRTPLGADPLPQLYLERARIKNIAFARLRPPKPGSIAKP